MKNKGRLFVMSVVVIVFLAINSFGSAVKFATDYLWFKEVGYTETFFTKIKAQVSIGVPIFIILAILLYIFIKRLKKKYDEAINQEGVVALAIATRPDCLSDEIIELINDSAREVE